MGFKKIVHEDIKTQPKWIDVSLFAFRHADEMAEKLGISKPMFLELAITSASPESRKWKLAENRLKRVIAERERIRDIKRRITWQRKKVDKKIVESELDGVMQHIANQNLTGKELVNYLKENGITLAVDNVDG